MTWRHAVFPAIPGRQGRHANTSARNWRRGARTTSSPHRTPGQRTRRQRRTPCRVPRCRTVRRLCAKPSRLEVRRTPRRARPHHLRCRLGRALLELCDVLLCPDEPVRTIDLVLVPEHRRGGGAVSFALRGWTRAHPVGGEEHRTGPGGHWGSGARADVGRRTLSRVRQSRCSQTVVSGGSSSSLSSRVAARRGPQA